VKKALAVLAVCFVVILALVGALSVVPHVHGNDFDHSTHKSCPIYQFSLHSVNFALHTTALVFVIFSLFFLWVKEFQFPKHTLFFTALLRAPPILS